MKAKNGHDFLLSFDKNFAFEEGKCMKSLWFIQGKQHENVEVKTSPAQADGRSRRLQHPRPRQELSLHWLLLCRNSFLPPPLSTGSPPHTSPRHPVSTCTLKPLSTHSPSNMHNSSQALSTLQKFRISPLPQAACALGSPQILKSSNPSKTHPCPSIPLHPGWSASHSTPDPEAVSPEHWSLNPNR